jgi:hypothetical protein
MSEQVSTLLTGILRTKGKDDTLKAALTDAILEALPPLGQQVEHHARLKVRTAKVVVNRSERGQLSDLLMKIEVHHFRGYRRNSRMQTRVRPTDDKGWPESILQMLQIFDS